MLDNLQRLICHKTQPTNHQSFVYTQLNDLTVCGECVTKQNGEIRTYLSMDCCEKGKFVCLAAISFIIAKSHDFSGGGELRKINEEKISY